MAKVAIITTRESDSEAKRAKRFTKKVESPLASRPYLSKDKKITLVHRPSLRDQNERCLIILTSPFITSGRILEKKPKKIPQKTKLWRPQSLLWKVK